MKKFIVTINILINEDLLPEELSARVLKALRHQEMPTGACHVFVLENANLTLPIQINHKSKTGNLLN